jgi:multidrug efflux pump subunit AcrA (membrane-fusion protein)
VLPQGNPKARTFPVKISLENPDMRIKSGMEVQVAFSVGGTRESLVVPKDAVVISGKDRLVYVVRDGVAYPEPVVVQGYFENSVSFEGNLKPGDVVVVRGNERLRPGQPVKVVQ